MCLDNFIGVRSCTEEPPKSGLYIEDLEGISVPKAAEITSVDANGAEFLRRKIAFAVREYGELFLTNLDKKEAECLSGCYFDTDGAEVVATPEYKGIIVKRRRTAMGRLTVKSVQVNVQDMGTLFVYADDGVDDFELEVEIEEPGVHVLPLAFTSSTDKLMVYAENTLGLVPVKCSSYKVGCNLCDGNGEFSVKGYLDGAEVSQVFGVVPDICFECDYEQVLCSVLHRAKHGALYYAGVAILKEYQATDRLGFLALHGQEWAASTIEAWQAKAEHFFNHNLKGVGRHLERVDAGCYVCTGTTTGYMRP